MNKTIKKSMHVVVSGATTIQKLKELKEHAYKKNDFFLSYGTIVNIAIKEYYNQTIKKAQHDEENKKSN